MPVFLGLRKTYQIADDLPQLRREFRRVIVHVEVDVGVGVACVVRRLAGEGGKS